MKPLRFSLVLGRFFGTKARSSDYRSRAPGWLAAVTVQGGVAVSQLALNLSLFFISALSSRFLPPEQFSMFLFGIYVVNLITILSDIGLNQASLVLSFRSRDDEFLFVNISYKRILFAMTAVCALPLALTPWAIFAVAVACATSTGYWAAIRVLDQYSRRFVRQSVYNGLLAVSRVCVALPLLLLVGDPIFLLLGIYVAATIPLVLVSEYQQRSFVRWMNRGRVLELVRFAPVSFISSMLFNSLPVITLYILSARGHVHASVSFGICLQFVGGLELLFGTARIYFLPRVMGNENEGRSQHLVYATAFLFLLGCAGLLASLVLASVIYGSRYPEIVSIVFWYFSLSLLTSLTGLFSLPAVRPENIRIMLFSNIFRVAATLSLYALPQLSALSVVVLSGTVILAGEVAVVLALLVLGRVSLSRPSGSA